MWCTLERKKIPLSTVVHISVRICLLLHLTNDIQLFKQMNTWTQTHCYIICTQQIRYSWCWHPDSLIPNPCQRDCLQLLHHAQLALGCVVNYDQSKYEFVCVQRICSLARQACVLCVPEWRLVSTPSLQLSCHPDRNIRVAVNLNQGIYPLCVNV